MAENNGDKRMATTPLRCGIPHSDKINNCTEKAENLFYRLVASCDDSANNYGESLEILGHIHSRRMAKGEVKDSDIVERLAQLKEQKLIVFYQVGGIRYLHIPNCPKYLRKDVKLDLRFPACPKCPRICNEPVRHYVPNTRRKRNATVTKTAGHIQSQSQSHIQTPLPPDDYPEPDTELMEVLLAWADRLKMDPLMVNAKDREYICRYYGTKGKEWCMEVIKNTKESFAGRAFVKAEIKEDEESKKPKRTTTPASICEEPDCPCQAIVTINKKKLCEEHAEKLKAVRSDR